MTWAGRELLHFPNLLSLQVPLRHILSVGLVSGWLSEQGKHFPYLIAPWAGERPPPTLISWSGFRLPSREAGMSGGTREFIPCFDAKDTGFWPETFSDEGHGDWKGAGLFCWILADIFIPSQWKSSNLNEEPTVLGSSWRYKWVKVPPLWVAS